MRSIFWSVMILAFAAMTQICAAQDDDLNSRLLVNDSLEDSILCTGEQAAAFYATLDGFFEQFGELADVNNIDSLLSWHREYQLWWFWNWDSLETDACFGVLFNIYMLERSKGYAAIERIIDSDDASGEYIAMFNLRAMAEADLASIAAGDYDYGALEINGVVSDAALCSNEQAAAFYKALAVFASEMEKLSQKEDIDSLTAWASEFHLWREDEWKKFYEQPCGVAPFMMYFLEMTAYDAAREIVTSGSQAALRIFGPILQSYYDRAAEELAVIEGLASE